MGCDPIIDGVAGGVSPQYEGIPASLIAKVRGQLNVEHYLGNEVSTNNSQHYLTSTVGVVTSATVNPATGDVISRGIWGMTVTPNGAALQACLKRQALDTIGIDGFGSAYPTLWACRFRVNSAEPVVASYSCTPGGLYNTASTTTEGTDGVYVIWDPNLGTPSWVVRCVRSGSGTTDSVPLATFDNNFHTAGFLHNGSEVIPFYDGVVFAAVTGANIQPNGGITSRTHHLITAIGGAVTPDLDLDFVIWGS